MDLRGYISDFLKSEPIALDGTDEFFLWHILVGYTSAYKLHSFLKTWEGPAESMAYKNVHRRVRRLFQARLLEEKKRVGGYKHGAINYRLTSRGLVYIFSETLTPKNIHEIMTNYPTNSLFNTFIYPFFEKTTLERSTETLNHLLMNYIEMCSYHTRYFLDPEKFAYYQDSPEPMIEVLEFQLKCDLIFFLLRAATVREGLIGWRESDKIPTDRNETFELLSRDRKFMSALKEYGAEICKGYKTITDLADKNRRR
jgi:hypothetical protein